MKRSSTLSNAAFLSGVSVSPGRLYPAPALLSANLLAASGRRFPSASKYSGLKAEVLVLDVLEDPSGSAVVPGPAEDFLLTLLGPV